MKSTLAIATYVLFLLTVPVRIGVSVENDEPPTAEGGGDRSIEAATKRSENRRADQVRKIAFEVADEKLTMKLFRADPELLNQRFMADVELYVPAYGHMGQRFEFASGVRHLSDLARIGQQHLIYHDHSRAPRQSLAVFFRRLVESLSGEGVTVPSVDFFSSDAIEKGYVRFSQKTSPERNTQDGGYFQFTILAPSEDLARERAETLIRMLDKAIARPLQEHLRDEIPSTAEEIETLRVELNEAQTLEKRLSEELTANADAGVSPDELDRLRTERRLLDVDLAGIRARIEASGKLLAQLGSHRDAAGARSRIEKLEDIKITAEIDLAGLVSRQKVLSELIEEGNKRRQLTKRLLAAKGEVNTLERRVNNLRETLQSHRRAAEAYSRLFSLKDDKITIRPMEWTQ